MPKDRIILAGDLHLKKKPGLWSSRFEIEKDDLFGLSQICSLAREHDADLFLLGDVFDAVANLPRAIVAVKEELDVLIEQGHEVKYIQGQHEMVVANDSNVPWLRMVSGTQHMHGEKFDFFGMKAFALDYFPQSLASLAMSKVPEGTEVLFLHGSCDLVLPPEFGCHFTADMLPESVCHVFAGDFHQHIRKETPTGTHIWYTGSTYMGDITELDTKYVYMVYGINGGIKVESLPLKQRRAAKYSSFDSEEAALAFFSEDPDPALPPELHKGVLIQDVPLEPDVVERLSRAAHIYATKEANPNLLYTGELVSFTDMMISDEEILEQHIDRESHPEEFNFTLDVIQNPVGDALFRLKERLGFEEKPQEKDSDIEETIAI